MCGRYTGFIDESDELKTIYTALKNARPAPALQKGEIFPSHTVPILTSGENALLAFPAVWGFPAFRGGKLLINARAETAEQKPAFADSFLRCRCAVPSTGYVEYAPDKRKYRIHRPDSPILWMAALYRLTPDGLRFVILTTDANDSVCEIHARMPLILEPAAVFRWCADTAFARAYRTRPMPSLVCTDFAEPDRISG